MAKINQKYLPKKLFICSGYFEPECFKRDLNVKLDFSTSSILMRKATKTDRTWIGYFVKKMIKLDIWMLLFLILKVGYVESNLEEN